MLQKLPGRDPQQVDVQFTHPVHSGTQSVHVVGEFNDWSQDAHPMTIEGDEARCTMTLDAGRAYRFRYLVDGHRWENDWAADTYVANDFGGDDSLLDLSDAPAAPTKKAVAKKAAATKKAPAKKAAAAKKAPAAKKAAPKKQAPPPVDPADD